MKVRTNPLNSLAKANEVMWFPWGLQIRAWVWTVGDAALLLNLTCGLGLSLHLTAPASASALPRPHPTHISVPGTVLAPHLARGRCSMSTGTPVDSASEADTWPQSSVAPCDCPCVFCLCSPPLASCLWCQPVLLIPSGSVPEWFLLIVFRTSLLCCILSLKSPERKDEGIFPLCRLSTAVCRAVSSGRLMGHWESWPPGKTAAVSCGTKQEACRWIDWDCLEKCFSPSGCSEAETFPEVGKNPDTPGRERNGCRVDDRLLGDAAAPVSLSHPIHQHRGVYWSGPNWLLSF